MTTWIICGRKKGKKINLEVCKGSCKFNSECAAFQKLNAPPPETEQPVKKEQTESNALPTQETDDTDVHYHVASYTPELPTIPSNGKAQRLLQQVLSIKFEIETRWFELGKVLQDIFEGRHYIDLGYSTWRDFCETALGPLELRPRAIDYLRTTRMKCDAVGIGKEIAGEIGWSKLKETIPVLTRENKDRWIEVAKGETVQSLNAKVSVERGLKTEEEAKVLPEKMFFALFKEQKEIVELALESAERVTTSDKRGYLISDVICGSFLSEYPPGIEFKLKPQLRENGKKKVYISGPYTVPDPEKNVINAIKVADKVLEMGFIPFIPHLSHYWDEISPKDWKIWIELDRVWILACDAVLRMPGESKGADNEVEWAKEHGIPVFTSFKELEDQK